MFSWCTYDFGLIWRPIFHFFLQINENRGSFSQSFSFSNNKFEIWHQELCLHQFHSGIWSQSLVPTLKRLKTINSRAIRYKIQFKSYVWCEVCAALRLIWMFLLSLKKFQLRCSYYVWTQYVMNRKQKSPRWRMFLLLMIHHWWKCHANNACHFKNLKCVFFLEISIFLKNFEITIFLFRFFGTKYLFIVLSKLEPFG